MLSVFNGAVIFMGIPTETNWQSNADSLVFKNTAFINGAYVTPSSGDFFRIINPYKPTGGRAVLNCRQPEIDLAARLAQSAFNTGMIERLGSNKPKQILYDLADRINKDAPTFALYDSLEVGKPISFALMEVQIAVDILRFCAEAGDKLYGRTSTTIPGAFAFELLEPRGVVAAIIPWNFPTIQCAAKIGAAIATGNACILKPSELALSSALKMAEMSVASGWPAEALSVVTGDGETGRLLAGNPAVDMISFTGSTKTGAAVMATAARSGLKKVVLECGGKSPTIVMDDAKHLDLEVIAQTIVQEVMWNQGQVCTAKTRLFVHAGIFDELMDKIVAACRAWTPGDPLDPETNFGPLVSAGQRRIVEAYIESGRNAGAEQLYGNDVVLPDSGEFVAPTVFSTRDSSISIAREEIFGPVLTAQPFTTSDEAITLANDSDYGLSATLWTTDFATANIWVKAIKAGMVRVNGSNNLAEEPLFSLAAEPYKQSGFGTDGGLSGLENMMIRKSAFFSFG
ncbi:aldehyde dehydrogenase family protein [Kineobactrum salinum]|uniref:Aldehyde dehydrogenase n=1 Tax=Kineobactrum salinum TaxID=2708301 RepID=A0A6C0TYJ0_9GAMM|nr:aldehyde dehydrogenase family protein [Kineobactrum salinum]QIB64603.1 aldehyde dehydrogenase [Kineobactrum salinum]